MPGWLPTARPRGGGRRLLSTDHCKGVFHIKKRHDFLALKPVALTAAIGIGLTVGAYASEPSFDCAKADGSVEELICKDAELAALDRKLSEVYAAALKRVAEEGYEDPRIWQRGWVKGRNDCWKAQDVRACVEAAYQHRIAELQIQYGQLEVPSPVHFACGEMDVTAVFYRETDPPTVVLTPIGPHEGDDQVIAFLSPSGSGAKYDGSNASFWEHQGEAMLSWFGKEMACKKKGD